MERKKRDFNLNKRLQYQCFYDYDNNSTYKNIGIMSRKKSKKFIIGNSMSTNLKELKQSTSMVEVVRTKIHTPRNHFKLARSCKSHELVSSKNYISSLSKCIVNTAEQDDNKCLSFGNIRTKNVLNVYRCQLTTTRETCCCSCNSDAMFEVMKSLYDCYKKKNCDNCNCILCGHLPREERRLGQLKKSLETVGIETASVKEKKMMTKQAEKAMIGKTTPEKEKILMDLVKTGAPLPKGKTTSEKSLIKKIRQQVGLPPTPKTASEKLKMKQATALGIITPLEGKTTEQKEKILRAQAEMGIPLPEGRSESEKALIDKIQPTKKRRITKGAGLLATLEGKSPAEKEKILRGLAMQGLPLPEGKTASEKKIIDEVRYKLGMPPEPKTLSMREKYNKAANAGLLHPLEQKSHADKEKILRGLYDLGIPLPEGRTVSEKALIEKVRAEPITKIPSEKLRKAQAEGLLTPLEDKPTAQKEKIIRGLAKQGLPLPEGKTASEKKMIAKIRKDMGLPPEPTTASMRKRHEQAVAINALVPLEELSPKEKERVLREQARLGISLPEGRTASEKALITKIKAEAKEPVGIPSEKLRKAKAEGLLTPLVGKTAAQKEKIMRGLAKQGLPLPEATTASEKKLVAKVRQDMGLPPEPTTASMRGRHEKAAATGALVPLNGLKPKEKEKVLRKQVELGIPLPEGRTVSEKALIAKVMADMKEPAKITSEKLRKARAAGLLTPLAGKSTAQKEKIMRGLLQQGLPLPEVATESEKKLVAKIRKDIGLPPEPTTPSMKSKYERAAAAGALVPLEGLSSEEKIKVLKKQANLGLLLPEGRTASEKALIAKVKAERIPSDKLRRAKAEGLLTPLKGKSTSQKEKIIRELAKQGLPLPEATTASEKKLVAKIRKDMGLPPEPTTASMRDRHERAAAAGALMPLEVLSHKDKKSMLRKQLALGIPLPEGRTVSEKALIAKVKAEAIPSEKLRMAKADGLLTPLKGKTTAQKEEIIRGLAKHGLPLPEATTASEKKLTAKIRRDMGLPPEPTTASMKRKHAKAAAAGVLVPLEGLSPKEKERILKHQANLGLPLPEGRTASEKALIAKVKEVKVPSEKIRRAKAEGLITPLEGKSAAQKEKILRGRAKHGLPLPEATTASENWLIAKVRKDMGLPPEPTTISMRDKHDRAAAAGVLVPLEGLSPAEKEMVLKKQAELGISLPEGRTASEKALIAKVKATIKEPVRMPSEKIRRAQAEGLLTPLEGKSMTQKEKIIRGLAKHGLPLPEATTASDKKLVAKIRKDMGLPSEPTTASMRRRHEKAVEAGALLPLEGLSPKEKERVLREQAKLGISLPEGRTASEKALITKIKAEAKEPHRIPSEKIRKAKAEGLLTPLVGKTAAQKEKIMRGLAKQGLPLPEVTTASEKKLVAKIRKDMGLPPEPTTASMRGRHEKAAAIGALVPLNGLKPKEKEIVLRKQVELGIPLPEGRTASENALIAKVKADMKESAKIPSEKLRRAKAEGLLTPLEGKTTSQKEKIVRGLAMQGLPLPEATTASEKKLVAKIRKDMGLPPEPTTASMRDRYDRAAVAGAHIPLEGLSLKEKENVLRKQAELGIPLPEGRTTSEKALIAKVRAEIKGPTTIPSEKLRKAKAAGLLTPLEGKTTSQKEKIIRGLAMQGLPLPEAITASEKKLVSKIRKDIGLPPEPATASMRDRYTRAAAAGALMPLEGLTPREKEKVLKTQVELGIPLPQGRTTSEKALIAKVKAETKGSAGIPSEKLRKAQAEGLLTPLEGKSMTQKEKIIRGLARQGLPLPEATTASDKKLVAKIRKDMGLPPEPSTTSMRRRQEKAVAAGALIPLDGLSLKEKERVLKEQARLGIALPEGRTVSEKALITKIKAEAKEPHRIPSEKIRKAKAEGLLTPLVGKTSTQKENIIRGLAKQGLPLPEVTTASEKKLVTKIRKDLGLPPEPTTASMRGRHEKAAAIGALVPLNGLKPKEKENVLRKQAELGIPLPEGRTASEKALIAKVKADMKEPAIIPSEKLRRAKAEGLLTPLEGKSTSQKEKIIRGLAMQGLPLPEATTASEKKIVTTVRKEMGLPPEPTTASMRDRYVKAAAAGALMPLEGLSHKEKEKVLKAQAELGIPLPQGRTASEKSLIAKIKAVTKGSVKIPSEKLRKAQAEGLLTPLEGKSTKQKEKIIRGLAKQGLPLPETTTTSEKKLVAKVRKELGLPPEPTTASMKRRHEKAVEAGVLIPLEGLSPKEKERVLREQARLNISLPEGRTASEKALIARIKAVTKEPAKIPSEKLRKAQAEGLLTPLEGKTTSQKEKIIRGLAKQGLPLPEATTASEKKLITKIRKDLGLPPEPTTASMRERHDKAAAAGALVPLEGLSTKEKETILRKQAELGISLPDGRTASEKALIAKVKAATREPAKIPSEKIRRAQAEGLLTPLEGKSTKQKEKIIKGLAMQGLPLPEATTASEKKLVSKIRKEMGLPPEPTTASMRDRYERAAAAGALIPLDGLSPKEKEKVLKTLAELDIPLPEGRTVSEKALIARVKAATKEPVKLPSENLRRAEAEGLLTPLEGKTTEQKEKIIKGLAKHGLPLPEATTASEKKLISKIRKNMGLPPEPRTSSMRERHDRAAAAGVLVPLEDLSPEEKETILRKQAELGIPLPEGRTASEKALIAKVKATTKEPIRIPSEKIRRAKAEGLLTPLEGKPTKQKEKIIRGLAMQGLPLPEATTASEKKLVLKIRKEMGLPPEPTTMSMRDRYERAAAAGVLVPLEGLPHQEKESVLRKQAELGIPLPEGRTASEKALIAKVKATTKEPAKIPSEKLRIAQAEGLLTPLEGKTTLQKENIIRGLAKHGLPLPEATTASDKKLISKIRKDVGLPPEPTTSSMRERHDKAAAAGVLVPLEGLSSKEKETVLRKQAELGIPLPEGRTASEKALIAKVKATTKEPAKIPSEKLRIAQAEGLLTPLEDKTTKEKEIIIRGLAKQGLPLPEATTASEKKLVAKIRKDMGLPPEPTTSSMRERHDRAAAAGILVPLEGLSSKEKETVLRKQAELGIPLPEGRTASEKALIAKVKATTKEPARIPSEKLRRAQAEGLLTPLEGKSIKQKEKIIRGLAKQGLPLPEATTTSEKKLVAKIRKDMGLPPEPTTASMRDRYERAAAAGALIPLEDLSPKEKERVLTTLADLGIPLPEGRTSSEKALIAKVKATTKEPAGIPSEKLKKARAEGLLTPLEGKTAVQKEKIIRGLAMQGLPLPEAATASEKKLVAKIRKDMGLPPEPTTKSLKDRYDRAAAAGALIPLEGLTPEEKKKVLRTQAELGVPLPEGRTPSEKTMIKQILADIRKPPKLPSDRLRKAKALGLFTPLDGKTPEEQMRIIRGIAEQGLPIPEGKTASQKLISNKVRKEMGLPPAPTTQSMRNLHDEAAAAGALIPLEGLSPIEKEKVLKKQARLGIPLPEGRTTSEKALIAKVKNETRAVSKIPSEKLRKAKAAGLLTPLEGKTKSQKEKIIRGLAESGIPLPEGKTRSERSLIHKIRTEYGLPPPTTTPTEKEVVRKAKAEGLFTPLAGKTKARKEEILRGLAEAGLPIPEGKTSSEKKLVKKIRAEYGLSSQATDSEKMGKIRTISKILRPKGKAPTVSKGVAAEELEDIIKLTTCDRACGCDRKKIRFKHSYIKIRVTSPDISALCPCPNECGPSVKNSAFVDNDGIKVTVGSAVGVPIYIKGHPNNLVEYARSFSTINTKLDTNHLKGSNKIIKVLFNNNVEKIMNQCLSSETCCYNCKTDYASNTSSTYTAGSTDSHCYSSYCNKNTLQTCDRCNNVSLHKARSDKINKSIDTINSSLLRRDFRQKPVQITEVSSQRSQESIIVIKSATNSSIFGVSASSCSYDSIITISIISLGGSDTTSHSSHYLCYSTSHESTSSSTFDSTDYFLERDGYLKLAKRYYYN